MTQHGTNGTGMRFDPTFYEQCENFVLHDRFYRHLNGNEKRKILRKFIKLCEHNETQMLIGNINSYSKDDLLDEIINKYRDYEDDYNFWS